MNPSSPTPAAQAQAKAIRELRVAAQARFDAVGLPRYFYSTRPVSG